MNEICFTIEAKYNHQNDRIHARGKEKIDLDVCRVLLCQKPTGVKVLAGITNDSCKTLLIFLEEGVKVDAVFT